jgi:hypothetical protein
VTVLPARVAVGDVFFRRTLAMPQKPTEPASIPSRFPLPGTGAYPGRGAQGVHGETKVTASIFSGRT